MMRYLVVLMLAAFMAQASAATINVSKPNGKGFIDVVIIGDLKADDEKTFSEATANIPDKEKIGRSHKRWRRGFGHWDRGYYS